MEIPIEDAAETLDDLVRRVEAGEAVILTENGRRVARLEPIAASGDPADSPSPALPKS